VTRQVTIALIALIVVVAGASGFSIYTWGYRSAAQSYDGYEPVLREWFGLSRFKVAKIRHLAGPFYAIRYRSRNPKKQYCVMVDVSTRYKGGSDDYDHFWWTGGFFGFTGKGVEDFICDF
jgi:hypothetical protein